jgi:two-component sensor histidine kinase
MRVGLLVVFLFVSLLSFSQTESLIENLKETPNDSLRQISLVKNLLVKSVSMEYDDSASFDTYNKIGLIFYSKNLPEFTEEFFYLAKQSAEAMGDYDKAAQMIMNIGVVREMSGDYVAALNNYQESLKAFNKTGNKKSQSLVYNNIAIVHQELGNNDQAYQNLIQSYNLKVEVKDSALIASALNNLGVFYEESLGDLDSALCFYSDAQEIYILLEDSRNTAICQNNIANLLFKDKKYDAARKAFKVSVAGFRLLDDKLWLSRSLMYSGQLEAETGNFLVAVNFMEESLNLLIDSGYTRNLMEVYGSIAKAYLKVGDFKNSALSFEQYDLLKDSLLNIDKQNEISKLEVKYQTTQKEFKIEALQREKEIQNRKIAQISSLIVAIIVILGFIIIVLYMRGKQRKLFMQNKNMTIKQQILQNQMNPHFLFNVLTSIQGYMSDSNTEKASDYLSKFSKLTRMVLQSSAQDKILLSEEIELLTNYIQLEQLRLVKSFELVLTIDNEIEVEEINIPPMMIQPFVENAIKHGLKNIENGVLELKILEKDSYILFSINDNGKGFEKGEMDSTGHKSMALGIINERADILKQKWKKDVSISFFSDEKGTKVDVKLPEI